MAKRLPADERFWSKVLKTERCWLWLAGKNKDGYGVFQINQHQVQAHRMSWLLHTGEIPGPGLQICHHCDNPGCVRPDHLFVGTNRDNVRDAMAKGRRRVMSLLSKDRRSRVGRRRCKSAPVA